MKQLIDIKVFQHKTKTVGKDNEPFKLYVIFRKDETKHLAFNNINWKSEKTTDDNLAVNYFEGLPDRKLEFIKNNAF